MDRTDKKNVLSKIFTRHIPAVWPLGLGLKCCQEEQKGWSEYYKPYHSPSWPMKFKVPMIPEEAGRGPSREK